MKQATNNLSENQFSDQWLEAAGFDLTPRRNLIADCWDVLENPDSTKLIALTALINRHEWYFDHKQISGAWNVYDLLDYRAEFANWTVEQAVEHDGFYTTPYTDYNITCLMLVLADLGELGEQSCD